MSKKYTGYNIVCPPAGTTANDPPSLSSAQTHLPSQMATVGNDASFGGQADV